MGFKGLVDSLMRMCCMFRLIGVTQPHNPSGMSLIENPEGKGGTNKSKLQKRNHQLSYERISAMYVHAACFVSMQWISYAGFPLLTSTLDLDRYNTNRCVIAQF